MRKDRMAIEYKWVFCCTWAAIQKKGMQVSQRMATAEDVAAVTRTNRVKAGERLGKDGGSSFSTIAEVIHLEIIR